MDNKKTIKQSVLGNLTPQLLSQLQHDFAAPARPVNSETSVAATRANSLLTKIANVFKLKKGRRSE